MARPTPLRTIPSGVERNLPHDIRKALKMREREEALARIKNQRVTKSHEIAAQMEKTQKVLPVLEHEKPQPIAPPVVNARIKPRHRIVFLSFLICVLGTNLLSAWYLWERAADRFVSVAGFSVRTKEASSAVERQPLCPRATTILAGFQAAEVGVLFGFSG